MRLAAIIALGALLAPVTLTAQEQPLRWQTRSAPAFFILAYEQPETDNQPISFACDPPARELRVMVALPPGTLRAGSRLGVQFASEGGRTRIPMLAEQSELDDAVMLRGTTRLHEGLAAVLARGEVLRLSFGQQSRTFPLAGSAAGVAALRHACGG